MSYKGATYLVAPGYVRSVVDGDLHYVSASDLIRLHRVPRSECLIYPQDDWLPACLELQRFDSLSKGRIVLRPKRHGDYTLPHQHNIGVIQNV